VDTRKSLETSAVDAPVVVIFSEDPDFSRAIVGRWQLERVVPAFTLMGGDACGELAPESVSLAILGRINPGQLVPLDALLSRSARPALLVAPDVATAQLVREQHPRLLVLPAHEGWQEAVVLLGAEMLRRLHAEARAQRAEQMAGVSERNASLGRFMLEMRHNLNNALTSVLGNSELLLLDPGTLPAGQRSQLETIRNMAGRMHEVLQRFSSLETEMRFMERQKENGGRAHAATAAH
jgi:signal transduction histidine kinase